MLDSNNKLDTDCRLVSKIKTIILFFIVFDTQGHISKITTVNIHFFLFGVNNHYLVFISCY